MTSPADFPLSLEFPLRRTNERLASGDSLLMIQQGIAAITEAARRAHGIAPLSELELHEEMQNLEREQASKDAEFHELTDTEHCDDADAQR